MSLLPQRKKSAEEIAKLRETLGITAPTQGELELPVENAPEPAPAPAKKIEPPLPAFAPIPFAELHDAKSAHANPIPVLPCEESGPPPTAVEHLPPPEELPAPLPVEQPATRIVRSLRKSEQGPVHTPPPPAPDSKLPIHRHSDKELNEIRRRETLAMIGTPIMPQTHTAHLSLVIIGYLLAIIGGVAVAIPDYLAEVARDFGFYHDYFEKILTATCAGLALPIAAFIYFRKPFSRHHAAFIGVITLFVIIFGALHYFPQLRHGT